MDYHEDLLFTDLALFNRKLADWLVFYNAERPHHSLGQRSPLSFLLQHLPECQRYWTHTGNGLKAPPIDIIAKQILVQKHQTTKAREASDHPNKYTFSR